MTAVCAVAVSGVSEVVGISVVGVFVVGVSVVGVSVIGVSVVGVSVVGVSVVGVSVVGVSVVGVSVVGVSGSSGSLNTSDHPNIIGDKLYTVKCNPSSVFLTSGYSISPAFTPRKLCVNMWATAKFSSSTGMSFGYGSVTDNPLAGKFSELVIGDLD